MKYRLSMKIKVGSDFDFFGFEDVANFMSGIRDQTPIEFELEYGKTKMRDHAEIARTLTSLHATVMSLLHDELERTGLIVAGPLQFGRGELMWGNKEPLTVDEVEAIELFDNSPIQLRVMKRGKVWPYGKTTTDEIPNLIEVIRVAHELGYPVKGLELLEALFSAVP